MASRLGMQRLSRFRKTLLKNRKVTLCSGSNTSKAEGSARHGGFWHESVAYLITYATLGCLGQTNCCAGDRQPVARKHTRFALRDLRHLTARAVGELGGKLESLDQRILCYNEAWITDQRAHDIVIRALDAGAITTTQVPEVLHEWREPSHREFLPRTAWSLFNAVTEVHKGVNPHTACRRGEALYGLFDAETGVHLGRN